MGHGQFLAAALSRWVHGTIEKVAPGIGGPIRLPGFIATYQSLGSGAGKEHATHRDAARLRQPAHRRSYAAALTWGVPLEAAAGGENVS